MKPDAGRQAAEDIEAVLPDRVNSSAGPRANRVLIAAYWGAAFHWIAYQQKHGKHKEKHGGLVRFLNDIGEPGIADDWRRIFAC